MLNFGFVGLGQGGGRLVDAFLAMDTEHYKGVAVNTAEPDLDGLKYVPISNRLHMKGNRSGAGRTPEIAYRSLVDDNGAEFFELTQKVFADSDFIWLVAGLGGGTGTGTLKGVLEVVDQLFSVPVGLIVTAPRDADSKVEIANALELFGHIESALQEQKIGSVIVVDNDRFYRQFAEDKRPGDWRDGSNEAIAKLLHEINVVTGMTGSSNFDATDFSKFLVEPGCLALSEVKLHGTLDANNVSSQIQTAMKKGFFASGYRFDEAKLYSLSFQLSEAGAKIRSSVFEKHVEDTFAQLYPQAYEKYISYYESSSGTSRVLSLISGLGLPERVFTLQERLKEIGQVERRKFEATSSLSEQLSGMNHLLRQRTTPTAAPGKNPFARGDDDTLRMAAPNPWQKR